MEYIGLVLCKHSCGDKPFLFRAPGFTHLNPGDRVVVETKKGQDFAEVICSADVQADDEECVMLCRMAGVENPQELKRVLQKVTFKDLEYEEG